MLLKRLITGNILHSYAFNYGTPVPLDSSRGDGNQRRFCFSSRRML